MFFLLLGQGKSRIAKMLQYVCMPQYAYNRDAAHRYTILEKFEAGIKSDGLWLVNAHIGAYKPAGSLKQEATRSRRLLVRRTELDRLIGTMHGQGATLVPLSMYGKRGLVKVELGLARGKKAYDKRADIKKRDVKRKIERAMRVKE